MQLMLRDSVAYIINQSWQIALLALIVGLVTLLLRKRSAHVRYILWLVVLAKCLVPPVFSVGIPVLQRDVHVMPTEQDLPLALSPSTDLFSKAPAGPAVLSEITDTRPAKSARKPRYETINPMDLLGVLWLTGGAIYMLIVLGKAGRIAIRLNKQNKPLLAEQAAHLKALCSTLDIKNPPKLWRVNEITQPFVWGFPRGSIYVPTDLWDRHAPERLNCTLAHELSHVIRLDAFVNLLQILAQGIFWFHPLVWWVNRRLREEREKCCDETAIALLNTTSDQYGSAIVETLAVQPQAKALQSSLAIVGPTQRIEERLRTIMEPNKRFYKTPNTASIVFVLILTAMAVSTTFHMHAVEAADLAKLPSRESTAEPNSPVFVSPDEAIDVECVVYEMEVDVLNDLIGKNSGDPIAPAVTMDQILIGKFTSLAKTSELVRWGESSTVVRLGEASTFARTTVIPYPTKYTINGYTPNLTVDSTSGKPLFKYAHTGLELKLTATRIEDSDMILIAIETKSKKLHYDWTKDTEGHGTQIPVIGGSFANAEVTAKFGQSILLSGLPLGGLASDETSDRCLAFLITPLTNSNEGIIGSHAPDFTLDNLEGGKVTLSKVKETVIVLAFGATRRGPRREMMPVLASLRDWATDNNKSVAFYSISHEPADVVASFQKKHGYDIPALLDVEHRPVFRAYKGHCIPYVVIVANGIIQDTFIGAGAAVESHGLEQHLKDMITAALEAAIPGS